MCPFSVVLKVWVVVYSDTRQVMPLRNASSHKMVDEERDRPIRNRFNAVIRWA
jgi:hypothetical protein